MSIFVICLMSLFITMILWGICFSIGMSLGLIDTDLWGDCPEPTVPQIIVLIILFIAILTGCICLGIGINTEDERVFVEEFQAKKITIEASLKSEELGGLERIELVKQATELNGEFAQRKAKYNRWHAVYYDNTIYDDIELINLNP